MERASPSSTHRLDTAWMVRLRWLLYAGQAALVGWMQLGLGMHLPLGLLAGLLLLGLGSNLALWGWATRGATASHLQLWAVMLFDTSLLTGLLAVTGGPFNPFTALYLVHVVLAALTLPPWYSWAQLVISVNAFAALFWIQERPPEGLTLPSHQELMNLHLGGMLVAFAVSGGVVVYFMGRVQAALRQRDAQLEATRHAALRNEKLAALTTLAAGAAHELATPLGTIALVAKELERALEAPGANPEVQADVQLIRSQVERCRTILTGMSASSGELRGEVPTRFPLATWVAEAQEGLADARRIAVSLNAAEKVQVRGPRLALVQALRSVLKNALLAGEGPVRLSATTQDQKVVVRVEDQGAGMGPQLLSRVGEPFFTTREPGKGMGLGVFLTRAVVEHLGGSLELDSVPGQGTRATLWIPLPEMSR